MLLTINLINLSLHFHRGSLGHMDQDHNRRGKRRLPCRPRPLDLCSIGETAKFYDVKVVDESLGGLGCILSKANELPSVGEILDWCGLKRYRVCWAVQDDEVSRIGLCVA